MYTLFFFFNNCWEKNIFQLHAFYKTISTYTFAKVHQISQLRCRMAGEGVLAWKWSMVCSAPKIPFMLSWQLSKTPPISECFSSSRSYFNLNHICKKNYIPEPHYGGKVQFQSIKMSQKLVNKATCILFRNSVLEDPKFSSGQLLLKGISLGFIFQISLFSHLLMLLHIHRSLLSTKAVLQKWHI